MVFYLNLFMRYILFLFILAIALSCSAQRTDCVNYSIPLKDLLDSLHIRKELITVHIDKSEYKLRLVADTIIIKEYPVVFGSNPADDKLRQGDHCTPEGTFRIKSKYPHNKWSKFIWIDYPNTESWKKHNAAKTEGLIPQDAQIGGEVGIHGVPENADFAIDRKINWTLGCISLKNKDIDELYEFLGTSNKVVITK
jgi:murein L,D-transpeptidase YafK